MEVTLQHFDNADCDYVAQKLFPNTSQDEALAMIARWKTLRHMDKYFEMFAVTLGGDRAGLVSLYENNKGVVSVGAILTPQFRFKGIAKKAILQLFNHARSKGYAKAEARVNKDNG